MKEQKQKRVPVLQLVISSGGNGRGLAMRLQQQQPSSSSSSSSSSSWSLVSSGCFPLVSASSFSGPATAPPCARLRFVEAKSTLLLNTGCEAVPSHEDNVGVKEETAIVDAAVVPGMEHVSTGGKENIEQVTVMASIPPKLDQCSRDGLQGRSPKKRGILTDNVELCNNNTAALKHRKPFEVPLAKKSKTFGLDEQRFEIQKETMVSPCLFENKKTRLNAEINQRMNFLDEKVNHHPYVGISDVREDQNSELKNVVLSSCLFQTASGKPVPISNAAIDRAISLIGGTSCSADISWNGPSKAETQSAVLKSSLVGMDSGDKTGVVSGGKRQQKAGRQDLEGQNISSLFQPVNGNAVSILNSGMNRGIALFRETNPGARTNAVSNGEADSTDLTNGPVKTRLLDKNVDILAHEFNVNGTSSSKVDLLNENVNADSCMVLTDSVLKESSEEPNIASSSCLFQTANGRPLSISNAAMNRAMSLIGGQTDSNCKVVGDRMGNHGIDGAGSNNDSFKMQFVSKKVSTYNNGAPEVDHQNLAASTCSFQNANGKAKIDFKLHADGVNSANIKNVSLSSNEVVGPCGDLPNYTKKKSSEEQNGENLKDVPLRTNMLGEKVSNHPCGKISDNIEKHCLESSCLFQTACSKAIPISEGGLRGAISLFGEKSASHSGVSKNGLCKNESIQDSSQRCRNDVEMNYDTKRQSLAEQNVTTLSRLFQTASGKTVSISDGGINRAATLFGEAVSSKGEGLRNGMDNDQRDGANLKEGFLSMGLGDNVNMHPYRDISDDLLTEESKVPSSSCLFQTASGKEFLISNTAMNRAAMLFDENVSTSANVWSNGLSKGGVDNINSKDFLKCEQTPNLNLFYTGQGQPVSVSSSAMKQAAKLLGQEDLCFTASAPLSSPGTTFKTGKGQSISVSSSAMKRAKHLLAAELDESGVFMTDHVLNGGGDYGHKLFQAGDNLIRVTSHSLERAKVLLGDSSTSNTGICKSTKTHAVLDHPKVHELTPIRSFKTTTDRKLEESNIATSTRKAHLARKYFKAPRRLQPEMTPKTTPPFMKTHVQTPRTCFLQLVKVYPLDGKGKQRCSLQDFFMRKPHQEQSVGVLTRDVKAMSAETSKYYRFSTDVPGMNSVGSDEFRHMLLETGASGQFATKEWVDNHFRWIVWKLASLERSYPTDMGNKLLSIQAVFDELRYRYEREVNSAHRSALKRITEGDALAGTGMVLCIAALGVKDNNQPQSPKKSKQITQSVDATTGQIELTDGWYSIIGQLDQPLVRQLSVGKIFVGQKLKICGASLVGCTTPMPPLEAFQTMKLALHINGIYRAHWAEKLGFCKYRPMPLAFHCIKHDGGLIPRTIIGISRIYPISYFEKLPDNKSVIRSARGEELAIRSYHHRRNQVAEAAFMRMEREDAPIFAGDMGEGAKLFHSLETAAEPELLMADMTAAQLAAFAAYQTKREAAKQALVEKNIQKALGEVHLDVREVTPFIEISVMGYSFSTTDKCNDESNAFQHKQKGYLKGGTVTVWQVTEEQIESLKEGAVYCVSNLYPCTQNPNGSALHLRATKLTKWHLLPQAKFTSFAPRTALEISLLGTIPFSSEFDVAVLVVHVGTPYAAGLCKKQWLFVSDGSVEENPHKNTALLAISISATIDAFVPVDKSLEGCIVGYCNLIKRSRDQRNCLWVAESSKSSVFTVNLTSERFSHLRKAANKVDQWFKAYGQDVAALQRRVQAALCGAP